METFDNTVLLPINNAGHPGPTYDRRNVRSNEYYHKIEANLSEHLSAMFNNSMDGILLCEPDGRILTANPAVCLMFGRSKEELRELSRADFVDVSDPRSWIALMEREANGCFSGEYTLLRKDGSKFTAEINAKLYLGQDQCNYAVFNIRDISRRKQAEKEMRNLKKEISHLDRLKIIGEMSASIAHEIRNPMTTVKGFLQVFKANTRYAEDREFFDIMIEEMDRANQIITEFLSLSKDKNIVLNNEDLNLQIKNLMPLLIADATKKDVIVQTNLGDIPNLMVDRDEIRQLILNLALNGIDAMPGKGEMKISTYQEGEKVILAIKDQGPGMAPKVLEKIGTPFFTTKQNGTGLGLPVCYSIAERHKAEIEVESSPQGTTFKVIFTV